MPADMIVCNSCHADLSLEPWMIHNRESAGVLYRYFTCPHCGAAYLISAYDDELRRAARIGASRRRLQDLSRSKVQEHLGEFRRIVPEAWKE